MAHESPVADVEAPRDCPLCPRLVVLRESLREAHPDWWNAPVPAFGDPDAWLAIVGLAPGMWGANRTGRPFTGDHAGLLFYQTLLKFGLAQGEYREQIDDGLRLNRCVILNSVKCLPPQNKPLPAEVATCRAYYEASLARLPKVRVLVALGRIAHDNAVRTSGGRLADYPFAHLAEHALPDGRVLVDSYHCSRYNQNTGRLTAAMFEAVFARALELRLLIEIRDVAYCDALFDDFLAEAQEGGGTFLFRLRDEWVSRVKRFDRPGEFLLGAFIEDALVGVGGVSLDPYDPTEGLGRVRHLYVLRAFRRRGIARRLVAEILRRATVSFAALRLRTHNADAAGLYESLGFRPSDRPNETHRLALQMSSTSRP